MREHLHWTPPLAHRLLWELSDAYDVIWDLQSIRRWQLREWHRGRTLRQRAVWINARGQSALRRRLRYLQRVGCVVQQSDGRSKVWRLTTRGQLQALATAALAIGRSRARGVARGVDHRQWLVVFDIPEELRRHRALLRRVLYGLDGKFLQRSVFLLRDTEGCRLLRHIVETAKLDSYVLVAEVKGQPR